MSSEPTTYRKNVAAVVVNNEGLVLLCERSDTPGAWQFPQGGIDEGENTEQALFREILEEIGTDQIKIIGKLDSAIRYEWPKELYVRGYRGQDQIYYLVTLESSAKINLQSHDKPEFMSYKWLSAADCLNLLTGFKRDTYIRALTELQQKFPGIILNI
jgi:putative (di)nucleoside polyphosphate hydrolase